MPEVINGFAVNPAALLETAFQTVADSRMRELPFYRPHIPVRACGFVLFEQQWLGCLLTPWMLNLLVLPGPDQAWTKRNVGEKLALHLPCGDIRFIVGEMAGCGQYLAASLMSPLEKHLSMTDALALAENTVRMALSLPLADPSQPVSASRRAFLRLRSGHA